MAIVKAAEMLQVPQITKSSKLLMSLMATIVTLTIWNFSKVKVATQMPEI